MDPPAPIDLESVVQKLARRSIDIYEDLGLTFLRGCAKTPHLDFRDNAKGNSLAKRLIEASIDPYTSKFNMLTLGPFFDEQTNFEEHKPLRDHMSTLEFEVANH